MTFRAPEYREDVPIQVYVERVGFWYATPGTIHVDWYLDGKKVREAETRFELYTGSLFYQDIPRSEMERYLGAWEHD